MLLGQKEIIMKIFGESICVIGIVRKCHRKRALCAMSPIPRNATQTRLASLLRASGPTNRLEYLIRNTMSKCVVPHKGFSDSEAVSGSEIVSEGEEMVTVVAPATPDHLQHRRAISGFSLENSILKVFALRHNLAVISSMVWLGQVAVGARNGMLGGRRPRSSPSFA